MSSIGERIRIERERMALTQPALAEKCGVTMRSQRNYEKGERSPDAEYLAALASCGLNVLYILTGQRTITPLPAPATASLSRREAALLNNYQNTDEAGKKIIEGTANLAAQSKGQRRAG
ncbi:helix-turn-helix transcriptional regulator [Ramlibacter sp. H39-3-26]|uniref:helix-turn-helix domain-containing protein n=1 Tax=Curvibacter soli TaxID=3031331 RepID=UPI0023DC5A68|nr:helix-turn-helix transcriptional regulator [Ramlibacter sp. H39-3-26]MDF1486703.1 helix-turn-helix transcriptional regulator [Ramlibacter sp. H39-3-26]